jgi:hypothetical protein
MQPITYIEHNVMLRPKTRPGWYPEHHSRSGKESGTVHQSITWLKHNINSLHELIPHSES